MRSLGLFTVLLASAAIGGFGPASQGALVAQYDFNAGSGRILKDTSGHGNQGRIHGARWVKRGNGYCLRFDGVKDYVDCGDGPSLNLTKTMTLEAWVRVEGPVSGEVGIFGKGFDSYLLTYYHNGEAYFYIDSGGNDVRSALGTGSWHHVAATFDGDILRMYIDGKLVNQFRSKYKTIRPGGRFTIGAVMSNPAAADPGTRNASYFPGEIDDLRVYDTALTAGRIHEDFARELPQFSTAEFQPIAAAKSAAAIHQGSVTISAAADGRFQLDTGHAKYVFAAGFSYPGSRIGWDTFSAGGAKDESAWKPAVKQTADGALEISAQGHHYRIDRRIAFDGDKIQVEDRLTNITSSPAGILIWNTLTAARPFTQTFAPGGAANPSIYLHNAKDTLGLLVEDDLGRLRCEPSVGIPSNQARLAFNGIALDAGKSYTLRWTIYLLPQQAGWFDYMNRVRRDWHANFPIQGPFEFFDIKERADLLKDPSKLRAFLQRTGIRLVGLSPWLDYDPGHFDHVFSRAEYRQRMGQAIKAFREADPSVKLLGCIETDWVSIDPSTIKGGEALVSSGTHLNAAQTRIIENAHLPWLDSAKRDRQDNFQLEHYTRGGKAQYSLGVFPAPGNYQEKFLLGQIQFLLDDMKLDGFYIDEFSQAWGTQMWSYGGWDGHTALIDRSTGKIVQLASDCGYVGIASRLKIIQAALDRDKVMVANTWATSAQEQSLPVTRFSETWTDFDPDAFADGAEPPRVAGVMKGNLNSLVDLGIQGGPPGADIAHRVMKAIVAYLRNGGLYFQYAIGDIPQSGVGAGDYGPIPYMYPITPVALHKGWIQGRERIITCVSGDYHWPGNTKPTVLLFDLHGRHVAGTFEPRRTDDGWSIHLALKDWEQIAVIQ